MYADDTVQQDTSIYQDKSENIVVARTKEDESQPLGMDLPESLESLSLDNVIVVDDAPPAKPQPATTPTPQKVVCKPKIVTRDGKIFQVPNTDPNCGDNATPPTAITEPQNTTIPQPPENEAATVPAETVETAEPTKPRDTQAPQERATAPTAPQPTPDTPPPKTDATTDITIDTTDAETIGEEVIFEEVVVVNPETHEQMVTRLADEANFFYTFGDSHRVFYPLPDPLPKKAKKISLLQADTIGLYSPKSGGIKATYWQDYDYVKVLNALQQADSGSSSYAYDQTLKRVVLSGTPVPKSTQQAGDIFAFRLQALMNAGRLVDAQKLLHTIPYDMRVTRYADSLAKIHIAYFDNASLCGLWHMQPDKVKTQAFWERTHILCLTLDGNVAGVEEAFKNAQNPLPEGFQALIEFGLKGTDIDPDTGIDINIWTVHLMRALGFGVDVPVDADMASYYGLLQNLAVPDDQRAYYAYQLFKQRSIPASFVGVVYQTVVPYVPTPNTGEMPFDVALESETQDIRYAHMPYWLRALSYQQAVRVSEQDTRTPNANTDRLIDIILQQIDRETNYNDRMTTVRLFAPLLQKIPAYTHPQSKRIAGILYASGYYDTAESWAQHNPMRLWYERTLYQILTSAPDTTHNVKTFTAAKGGCGDRPLNPSEWMAYVTKTDADNAVYRISEAFMTLESLGCVVGNAYWQQLADMTPLLIQDIIAPAHIRTLQVKYNRAVNALPVVLAIKPFVERVDISHMEMAKVYTLLYDIGYAKLAAQIAYERNTYNPW